MPQTKQKPTAIISRHKKQLKTVAIAVIIYITSLFVPFIYGFSWYPIAIARCGGLPVVANDFAAAWSYTIPGDALYEGPSIFTSPNNYYCSASEAESAGYHPYVWGPERCKTSAKDGTRYCAGDENSNWPVTLLILIVIAAGAYYFRRRTSRQI